MAKSFRLKGKPCHVSLNEQILLMPWFQHGLCCLQRPSVEIQPNHTTRREFECLDQGSSSSTSKVKKDRTRSKRHPTEHFIQFIFGFVLHGKRAIGYPPSNQFAQPCQFTY